MRERIGWAVVHRSGQILDVTAYQRKDAVRMCVDPAFELSKDERRERWKDFRKRFNLRVVKVRISPVEGES